MATLHFAGWHVREQQPSLDQRIDASAFWYRHSTERRDVLRAQQAERLGTDLRRGLQAERLARILVAPVDRARMDAVHESRASRRRQPTSHGPEGDYSRLDRLDGLGR